MQVSGRKIVPVVKKVMLKYADNDKYDLEYWLTKSVKKRAAAVTFIISQSLKAGQRMDKTKVVKTNIKA